MCVSVSFGGWRSSRSSVLTHISFDVHRPQNCCLHASRVKHAIFANLPLCCLLSGKFGKESKTMKNLFKFCIFMNSITFIYLSWKHILTFWSCNKKRKQNWRNYQMNNPETCIELRLFYVSATRFEALSLFQKSVKTSISMIHMDWKMIVPKFLDRWTTTTTILLQSIPWKSSPK